MAIYDLLYRKRPSGTLAPRANPDIIWGNGAPQSSTEFSSMPVGSLYIRTDSGSSAAPLYIKVGSSGSSTDWVSMATMSYNGILSTGSSGGSAAYIRFA